MKRLIILVSLILCGISYAQPPKETTVIRQFNNRELYYGKSGYLGYSSMRGNARVYVNKKGVYSRQYIDGAGTTRIQFIRPDNPVNTFNNKKGAIAGSPARSAESRGFKPGK